MQEKRSVIIPKTHEINDLTPFDRVLIRLIKL